MVDAPILAADDTEESLFSLVALLEAEGYRVVSATDGEQALAAARTHRPQLILLDVRMPKLSGFDVTRALKTDPELRYTPIVLVTAQDGIDDVLEGFSAGADDYIRKPFDRSELLARIRAATRVRELYGELERSEIERRSLRELVRSRSNVAGIIGQSAALDEVLRLIERVKDSNLPVLITGESGTGKELVARALHFESVRHDRPFVVQNCAALQEQLLESELFGHVRGAFTGALRDKPGLFEVADGGTFFLDELGELSQALQAKLLRVLQDGTFTSVGSTTVKHVDVRVVAATNRDLHEMMRNGTFREDLFYRINVVNIRIPPLRERRDDVPLLVEHFLAQHAERDGRRVQLSADALRVLCDYDWPGNIRELENEVARLVVLSDQHVPVPVELLSPHLRGKGSSTRSPASPRLRDAVEALERQMISDALRRSSGNRSEAARELGISRSSLIAKIAQYELTEGNAREKG